VRGFKIIRAQHVTDLFQQVSALNMAGAGRLISMGQPCFLLAASLLVVEFSLIVCYQSQVVRPTDRIYRPVQEALGEHPMRLVMKETIPDPSMMFGSGELSVYQQSNDSKPELTPEQFEAFITNPPPPDRSRRMTQAPAHRSVSQINSYDRCPYAYYLARIKRVWQRPAAWLGQGTAVHEAAEAYERSKLTPESLTLDAAQDVFRESYAQAINQATEITPDFNAWFASGPYQGATDVERRYGIGLGQVASFVDWTDSHPEEVIWIAPDGTPGIEIGFDIDLDGVPVRGFIDAVIDLGGGEILVRDYKTGNKPGSDFQLGVYSVAIAGAFGVDPPQVGDFWMGRTGKPTREYPIGDWTRERVTEEFHRVNDQIIAGNFPAKPDPKVCNFCDVSASCEFAGR
jgi:putative RecB family exonuclease